MKITHALVAALILTGFIFAACGERRGRIARADSADASPAPWDLVEDGQDPPEFDESPLPEPYQGADSVTENVTGVAETVDTALTLPADMKRYGRIGRLGELFNDSNKYQYAAAERIGIQPIRSLVQAYYLQKPLVEIASCRWYDLDTLTHSMPYLVPQAANLLETIGRSFTDSLVKRGAPGHKFRVTSVLRTPHSVKRLRRVNGNATDSSTHQFATTFDISYSRFNYYGGSRLSEEELKYVLAEVLRDLRAQGRCLVKYERKSPCFHITATGR